ncbi:flagellar hook-basal body complex protein FliE [Sphingomonas sp. MMS24-JH45]
MSGIGGVGGIDRVMALRQQILERNTALSKANVAASAPAPVEAKAPGCTSFADTMSSALEKANAGQQRASALSEQYERGKRSTSPR